MPNCKEVAVALSTDEFEGAGWGRRLAVRFHLLMCPKCRCYAAQLRAVGAAVRELLRRQEDDGATVERLKGAVLAKLGGEERD